MKRHYKYIFGTIVELEFYKINLFYYVDYINIWQILLNLDSIGKFIIYIY